MRSREGLDLIYQTVTGLTVPEPISAIKVEGDPRNALDLDDW